MNKNDIFSSPNNSPVVLKGTWSPAGGVLPSTTTYPKGSKLKATTSGTISGVYYKIDSFIVNVNGTWVAEQTYNYADLINTPNAAALYATLGATAAGILFVTLNTSNVTQQGNARTNLGMSTLGSSLVTSANKAAFYSTLTLDTDLAAKENISNRVQNLSSPSSSTYLSTSGLSTYFTAPTFGNVIATTNTVSGLSTLGNITTSDPIVTIGGNVVPTTDDLKSKGIEFRWHNGTTAKLGFFGFDRTTQNFRFIPDATNTSELISGTVGTIESNLLGNVTGNVVGNATTATSLATSRTISTTGDVVYTSGGFNGSANVTGTATLSTTGVTAGTYKSVTVDAKGRVTAGTNPTTLAGYGITDAQATLVSGTNIKTVNGISILGSGNVLISAFDGNLATNLNFTTTGLRITGDFSNATFNSRLFFQTSTANGNTSVGSIPNGTGVAANYIVYNNSDTTNCAYTQVSINGTASDFVSGVRGTGTALPMIFSVNGANRVNILPTGQVGINNASPVEVLDVIGNIKTSSKFYSYSTNPGIVSRNTGSVVTAMLNYTSYQDNTNAEVGWFGYGAGDGTFGINNSTRLIKLLSPTQIASISGDTTLTGNFTATTSLNVSAAGNGASSIILNSVGTSHLINFQTGGTNRAFINTTSTGISLLDSTGASKLTITTAGASGNTPTAGDNSNLLATTAFVTTAVSGKQNSLGYTPLNKAGDTMTGTFNGRPTGTNIWFTYSSAADGYNYGAFINSAGTNIGYIGSGNGGVLSGYGATSFGVRAIGTLFLSSDADDVKIINKTTHSARTIVRYNAGASPTYTTGQFELNNSASTNPVVLGFHAEGVSAAALVHLNGGNGLEVHSASFGSYGNLKAATLIATSGANVVGNIDFSGVITGNGSGLTNLNSANLTGTINVARLPFTISTSSSTSTVVQRDGSGDIYINNLVGSNVSLTGSAIASTFSPSLSSSTNNLDAGLRWFSSGIYNYGVGVSSASGGLEYHSCQGSAGMHRWYTGAWNSPVNRMYLDSGGNLVLVSGAFYGSGIGLTGVVQKNTPTQTLQNIGTVSGSVSINAGNGTHIIATVNGNTTFTFPAPSSTESIAYTLELTGGGSYVIAFNSGTKWKGGTQPVLTTGKDILVFTKAGTDPLIGYDPTKNVS